jgi:ABC-type multidrug transport system permease subunit
MSTQFVQLGYRTKIFGIREPWSSFIRIVTGAFFGSLLSMLWYQSNGTSQVEVKNMTGVLFMMIVNNFVGNFFATVNTFQFERDVMLREQANNMYSLFPYFITKGLIEQPLILVQPLALLLVTYWTIGFNQSGYTFGYMYLAIYMTGQVSVALGLIVSAACESVQTGTSISMLICFPAVLFGGYVATQEQIPPGLRWLTWISPIRYSFECMLIAEFEPRGMEYVYLE